MAELTDAQIIKAYRDMSLIGQNLKGVVVGKKFLMEIDLDVELGLSSTGATFLKSNSGGPIIVQGFPAGVKANVTMTRKNPDYIKPPKA